MNFKIIAVDFDGTLCTNKWPEIGQANLALIDWLKQERKSGTKLILWTCRTGEMLDKAVNWCIHRGLEFDSVNDNIPEANEKFGGNSRKVFANIYLDDSAIPISATEWVNGG